MCNVYLPPNVFIERHITCHKCKNNATIFMIQAMIESNKEQMEALNNMKLSQIETISNVDVQGRAQFTYKVVGTYKPWFAENSTQIPVLVPVCDNCKPEDVGTKYLMCHYSFEIYRLQQRRFKTSMPYHPWIKDEV